MTAASPTEVHQAASWHRYGHLLVVYLVWGSTYLAVKICVGGSAHLTPLQLQTGRLWCASLVLLALSAAVAGKPRRLNRADLLGCGVTGLLMWTLGNGFATLASPHASSSFIVMALGMIPVWTTVLTSLIERRVPPGLVILGLALGVSGMGLIFGPPILMAETGVVESGYGLWVAVVLTLAGTTWSLGSVLQRPILRALQASWAASFQMLAAALALTAYAAWRGEAIVPQGSFDLRQIAAFAFLVLFGSVLCMMSYLKVLQAFSPSTASTFAYVNPVVGIVLGYLVLSETPGFLSLGGMVLILIGVFLVLSQAGRRPAPPGSSA